MPLQQRTVRGLILHFDLNTKQGDRSEVYEAIQVIGRPSTPQRLTGSVYFIGVRAGVEPAAAALDFWQELAKATKGKLKQDDEFYLHHGVGAGLDTMYQRVEAGESELDPDPGLLFLKVLWTK